VQLLVDAGIATNIWNVTLIEPGVERGYRKPLASLSSKVRKNVSKAENDAMLEQVPGDGGGPLVAE